MSEISDKHIKRIRGLLQEAETNLIAVKELLASIVGDGETFSPTTAEEKPAPEGKVIIGIFDGQIMLDETSGKPYPVPANYASKSKLVEGDLMKLTISDNGRFVYKQIGPVERKTVIGTLIYHDDKYFVEVNGKEYNILYASVTYFQLKEGSQVSVVIPANDENATWAAVEAAL